PCLFSSPLCYIPPRPRSPPSFPTRRSSDLDRRHDRIVPRNPIALLTLEDGSKMTCRIIDLSLSGAAIAAENRPPLKSLVMLGKVDRKSTRLNSSHQIISYAVFCLQKKKKNE